MRTGATLPGARLARTRIAPLVDGRPAWAIPWPCVHEFCLQHCVRDLWSADRDFSRFPGFNTSNPLIG